VIIKEAVVVRDLCTDLADGQILALFICKTRIISLTKAKLTGQTIEYDSGITDKTKRSNFVSIFSFLETNYGIKANDSRWSIDGK
jgi:hypothetical protein